MFAEDRTERMPIVRRTEQSMQNNQRGQFAGAVGLKMEIQDLFPYDDSVDTIEYLL